MEDPPDEAANRSDHRLMNIPARSGGYHEGDPDAVEPAGQIIVEELRLGASQWWRSSTVSSTGPPSARLQVRPVQGVDDGEFRLRLRRAHDHRMRSRSGEAEGAGGQARRPGQQLVVVVGPALEELANNAVGEVSFELVGRAARRVMPRAPALRRAASRRTLLPIPARPSTTMQAPSPTAAPSNAASMAATSSPRSNRVPSGNIPLPCPTRRSMTRHGIGAGKTEWALGRGELFRWGRPNLGVPSPLLGPAATVKVIRCMLETAFR